MSEPTRWTADQVLAVAPDQSSLASARKLAGSADWSSVGVAQQAPVLWGLCKGSGKSPYQTCVDLTEPAYRCSCPSRKFPCKHALALLLKWSAGAVPVDEPPAWVEEWLESRSARAAKKAEKVAAPRTEAQELAAQKRAQSRHDKVLSGVAELQQWLSDQVRNGIAGLESGGYRHFEPVAARLIDAQAPGLAGAVRRLATIPSSGAGWEERTLAEMSMLHLLAGAADRLDTLPPDLAATVRSRLGHPVTTEQVLAGAAVRDVWQVIGTRDLTEDRLVARRVYLIGRDTGREALVLSFAAPGQVLSADLVVGTCLEADLCFYPGSFSLRALVASRHGAPELMVEPEGSTSVAAALDRLSRALGADPWLMSLPLLIDGVIAPGERWHLVDPSGDALPLEPGVECWRFVAAAGGAVSKIAVEWGPAGLVPLTMFRDGEVLAA
ncbi:SWIM zinc finger family protein [Rhizocola hellebori]|nr:SWIM zinc finger family protein [Rhizocola hellebori]